MTTHAPIFARERNAARVLDMTPAEFRALVVRGLLPGPRRVGDVELWEIDELRRVISGEAIEGDVQW